jgi:hypothetical protein
LEGVVECTVRDVGMPFPEGLPAGIMAKSELLEDIAFKVNPDIRTQKIGCRTQFSD